MKVSFDALIVKVNIRRSASMDKEGKLTLEFLPEDETVDQLNRLMVVDEQVSVEISKK